MKSNIGADIDTQIGHFSESFQLLSTASLPTSSSQRADPQIAHEQIYEPRARDLLWVWPPSLGKKRHIHDRRGGGGSKRF